MVTSANCPHRLRSVTRIQESRSKGTCLVVKPAGMAAKTPAINKLHHTADK